MDWLELLTLRMLHVVKTLHLYRLLNLRGSIHHFGEYFKGFEKIEPVRAIFGEKTEEVLRNLKVELTWIGGHMWINISNGISWLALGL